MKEKMLTFRRTQLAYLHLLDISETYTYIYTCMFGERLCTACLKMYAGALIRLRSASFNTIVVCCLNAIMISDHRFHTTALSCLAYPCFGSASQSLARLVCCCLTNCCHGLVAFQVIIEK